MDFIFIIGIFVLAGVGVTAGWVKAARRLRESLQEREDLTNSSLVIEEERQMLELIADGAPLEKVLNTLNLAIERLSPGALCSVMLLDEEYRRYLTVASAPSLPRDYQNALVRLEIGPGVGACGTAAYLNETVVVTDIATDPKFEGPRDFILSHGLRSCWSQPVRDSRNRVLGTFAIYHGHKASPRPEELHMARVAAQLAGNAIERTRAQTALAEARKRLNLAESVARFGIWEVDFRRNLVTISGQMAAMLERPAEETCLSLAAFEAAAHPEDLPSLHGVAAQANAGTDQREFRLVLPSGAVRWMRSHFRYELSENVPIRAIGTTIDITDEVKLLEESRKARADAEAAAEAARQAERLEQDRTIILEMVARDEPLQEIAQSMACAIASHLPLSVCAIRIELPDALPVFGFAGLTEGAARILERTGIAAIRQTTLPEPIRNLSANPEWQAFIDAPGDFPYRFYRAVPILRNSLLLGLIIELCQLNTTSQMGEYLLESWTQYATLAVERRGLYDQLSFRAQYDSLTNLLNRASLYDRAGTQILRARTDGTSMAVVYLDLDRFKEINDRHGHAAGDKVLQDVSRRILQGIRRTDYAARIGGDEFVVILPGVNNRGEAGRIADLLAHAIEEPVLFEGRKLSVGASFGISIATDDGIDIDTLLSKADAGMYRCKLRNRPRSYMRSPVEPEPVRFAEPVPAN